MKRRGYSYTVSDEKIAEFARLSTADKLRWLDEYNRFMEIALTPKEKELRERFRKGEI
jgi:hypothetical protein